MQIAPPFSAPYAPLATVRSNPDLPPPYEDDQDHHNLAEIQSALGPKLIKYAVQIANEFDVSTLKQIQSEDERLQFLEYLNVKSFPDKMAFKAMFERLSVI